MFCSTCGGQIPEDAIYCSSCGRDVRTTEPPATPARIARASHAVPSAAVPKVGDLGNVGALKVWVWILSVAAILFLPPVTGGIAIYLATRVRRTEPEAGGQLLAVAICLTVVGCVIGAIVGASTFRA